MTVDTREPRHFEAPQGVKRIEGPGDYKFEFTGRFPLIDREIHDFFTRNFPHHITPLRFTPARLSGIGDYIPASLGSIEDWMMFDSLRLNYLAFQGLSDPEYYSVNTGGYHGGHELSTHIEFTIKDIGRLSVGENKLRVQIDEPAEDRDGELRLSVYEGILATDAGESTGDKRLVSGRVSLQGDHPGFLVRSTRAYINLFSRQGASFSREK